MKNTSWKRKKIFYLMKSFWGRFGNPFFPKRVSENKSSFWRRRRFLQVLPITAVGLVIRREERPTQKKMLSLKRADWWEEIES